MSDPTRPGPQLESQLLQIKAECASCGANIVARARLHVCRCGARLYFAQTDEAGPYEWRTPAEIASEQAAKPIEQFQSTGLESPPG